jgi:DNA-binding NtrC family response regulator
VRELKHAIQRAFLEKSSEGHELNSQDFHFLKKDAIAFQLHESSEGSLNLEKMEKDLIVLALKRYHGHRGQTAKALGVARSTLFQLLKRHGLMTNLPAGIRNEHSRFAPEAPLN